MSFGRLLGARTGLSGVALGALMLATTASGLGCGATAPPPPEAIVSPMSGYLRPAKAPDCPMPVLHAMPDAAHQQIAIVDAWGDEGVKDSDVLAILKRKACQTGADAIVLTADRDQELGPMVPGYAPGPHTTLGEERAGANVSERYHLPQVGEQGHAGHYLSGIAIIYTGGQNPQSAAAGAN